MGQTDPYQELGVDRLASDREIKEAFKKRARETHPDAGGSDEDFSRASNAHALLLDPIRRAQYDATGEDVTIRDIEADAVKALRALMHKTIERTKGDRIFRTDVVQSIRKKVEESIQEGEAVISAAESETVRLEKMLGKMRCKSGNESATPHVWEAVVGQKIGEVARAATLEEKKLEVLKRVWELAGEYEWEMDDEPTPLVDWRSMGIPVRCFNVDSVEGEDE